MIELRGVSKSYGGQLALAPATLRFDDGKTTALIGPSGCGKSTILRLVIGLIEPDEGEISIGGKKLTPETLLLRRRGMGYVIQEGGLFPHLTAEQNVWLMMKHLGEEVKDCVKRVTELAKLTRFPEDALTRYPGELSGGQRQRVSLMRALALDPPILLLDEPLGALDPLVRNKLQTDLKEIFETLAKTVVFVTHDMGEAAYLADSIVLLREGKVVQQGSLEDFQKRPADPFVTEFLSAQRSLVTI
ncbi:MAG TPA: ATP-binding cassette domain-containing protein [Fimbriimonadaceae bacterium]|nr:ATP-binding cassette domain-containing protein [Fimbriimonadaceae bacterium]